MAPREEPRTVYPSRGAEMDASSGCRAARYVSSAPVVAVPPTRPARLQHPAATALRLAGTSLVLLALGTMWASRIVFQGNTSVSGLGAAGEITALALNISLGMVALGGAASAFELWGLRSGRGLFGAWAVSTSLVAASAMFAVGASRGRRSTRS